MQNTEGKWLSCVLTKMTAGLLTTTIMVMRLLIECFPITLLRIIIIIIIIERCSNNALKLFRCILALEGCAVLLSSKSCFCAAFCPSHFPSSLLVLVSIEFGKYPHWVSQCDGALWWLLLFRSPWLPARPTWGSHFAWHHHLLSDRHLPLAHLLAMSLSTDESKVNEWETCLQHVTKNNDPHPLPNWSERESEKQRIGSKVLYQHHTCRISKSLCLITSLLRFLGYLAP